MLWVGIDVGGMSIKGGLVNAKGKILLSESVTTQPQAPQEETIGVIAELSARLIENAEETVGGVGIGIPGTIDAKRGVVVYANNIRFENVPMAASVSERLGGLRVEIGNDANCAALGEVRFGSGKGYENAVFVTLGTGVGSGIVLDGTVYEGRAGAGAEAGHMVICSDGECCTCGRKGCWEAYASATALIRMTKRALEAHPESKMAEFAQNEGKVSGKTAFLAARAGDTAGLEVVAAYENYVAEGLVNLVNIFRPEILLIGGGVSHEGAYFIDALQKIVDARSYGGARNPRVEVKAATLGNAAGILGAAALVI